MKVGIVGFGSIGTEVAKALIIGVENFSLYGVVSRSRENVEQRILQLNHQIKIFELETLIENNLLFSLIVKLLGIKMEMGKKMGREMETLSQEMTV